MSDDVILGSFTPKPTMKPTVSAAKALAECIGANQVVVIAFDGSGNFATITYGATRELCREIKRLGYRVAEALEDGELPAPESA